MMKIEEFHDLFNCQLCKKLLENPVILPCGETLCKKDLGEFITSEDRLRCPFCTKEHLQTSEGFPMDRRIQKMIDLKVNQLDFGPVYNNCKKALKGLTEQFNELDLLKQDLNDFILGFYVDLKKEVDLRKDDLKMKIDQYADQIIENILNTEKECLSNKRRIEDSNKELVTTRRELDMLILEFDSFEINDKKFNAILYKADQLKPRLTEKIAECKKFLCSNKAFKFEFNMLNIQEIFGSLKCIDQKSFPVSTILSRFKDVQNLFRLCKFPEDWKWNLIYRASTDGFSAKNFHLKCDGFKNTLTVIRTSSTAHIFGGFTAAAWSQNEGRLYDNNAFIFSLVNNDNNPIVIKCSTPQNAIYCDYNYGPFFGYGGDLYISDNSNMNTASFSNLGICYKHPLYSQGSTEARTFLSGSFNFQTSEIEVFAKQ